MSTACMRTQETDENGDGSRGGRGLLGRRRLDERSWNGNGIGSVDTDEIETKAGTQGSPDGHRWRDLATGILFVGGLLLLGTLALIIGKNTNLMAESHTLKIFTTDIEGLAEGNPVSISGKKVGNVATMELTRRNDTSGVLIDLEIFEEYFPLVTSDSKATIKSIGVLGDKYVDISLGSAKETIRDGEYLALRSEPGLDDLTATAINTVGSLGKVSDAVLEMTGKINRGEGSLGRLISSNDLNDQLVGTISNLRAITGRLSSNDGIMARLFNDREAGDRLMGVIASLQAISDSVSSGSGTLGRLMMDDRLYTELSAVTRRADSVITFLQDRNSPLNSFSANSEIYANLNRSIASLDSLFIDVRKNPKRYVSISLFD